jgi:phage antirepressor YoqD-like protein
MIQQLTAERKMTVKEVADVLGCNPETVKKHIREFWPDVMKNGVVTYLTEAQVTVILERMKQGKAYAHNVSGGDVAAYNSGIVATETTQSRAFRIELLHKQIEAELEAEIIELKSKAETDKPKVEFFDQVADSADALQMRDVAGVLNLSGWGRNRIFDFLRKHDVLDDRNIPYREYQDRGYFRVVEQKYTDKEGDTHINLKTLVYQRGVDFILKLIQEAALRADLY